MMINNKNPPKERQHAFLLFAMAIFVLSILGLGGCSDSNTTEEPAAVDYAPLAADDWEVSTPAEQGLDSAFVREISALYASYAVVEFLLMVLIVWHAWKWPKLEQAEAIA